MGSVCRCLFQYCCESQSHDDDDDVDNDDDDAVDRPQQHQQQSYSSVSDFIHPIEGQGLISSRGEQRQQPNRHSVASAIGESSTTLASASTTTVVDDNDDDARTTTCCRPASSSSTSDPDEPTFYDIIRRRISRWNNNNQYDAVVTGNDLLYRQHFSSASTLKDGKLVASASPLRQAISFNPTNDLNKLCTINADEIVLPGSMLQQKMAEQMLQSTGVSNALIQSGNSATTIDECVICMEPFDSTNPRMPTLCHCGTNKTYFHLPCLYQWIDQSEDCPSCRTRITWEEF